jgi:O-antigen/teichoic acid export membrane protein
VIIKNLFLEFQSGSLARYRPALKAIFANFISKFLSIFLIVFSIRLTLPYLGQERYGMWVLISSLTSFLTILDLGVANSIPNRISYAVINYKKERLYEVVIGCLGVLLVISFLSIITLSIITTNLPWEKFLGVSDINLLNEAKVSAKIFIYLFSYNILIGGIARIYQGFQLSHIPHIINSVATLFSISTLFIACHYHADVPLLIISTFGVQCLINSLLLFYMPIKYKINKKTIILVKNEYKKIINSSKLFFIMQIGQLVGWGADNLIVSWHLGASSVAILSITMRLFQIVSLPLLIFNAPLWAAYSEAHHQSDQNFIKKTFQISFLITLLLSTILGGVLVIFSEQIIELLTKDTIKVGLTLIFSYYALSILEALGNSISMYLNGTNQISMQVNATIIFVVIGLPLKLLFINYGLSLFIAATIISYVIAVPLYYTLFHRSLFSRLIEDL